MIGSGGLDWGELRLNYTCLEQDAPETGLKPPHLEARDYFFGSSFLASSFFSTGGATQPLLMSKPGSAA